VNFEEALSPKLVEENARMLTSFRDPLTHFFSGIFHNAAWNHGKIYRFHHEMDMLRLQLRSRGRYYLRNFQSKFLIDKRELMDSENMTVVTPIIRDYVKSLYWFAVAEFMDLSLALLQCQVFGKVRPAPLKAATTMHHNKNINTRDNFQFQLNSTVIASINSYLKLDLFMYQLVVVEFWNRVAIHKVCLHSFIEPYMFASFDN
jgi:hypothetical protein